MSRYRLQLVVVLALAVLVMGVVWVRPWARLGARADIRRIARAEFRLPASLTASAEALAASEEPIDAALARAAMDPDSGYAGRVKLVEILERRRTPEAAGALLDIALRAEGGGSQEIMKAAAEAFVRREGAAALCERLIPLSTGETERAQRALSVAFCLRPLSLYTRVFEEAAEHSDQVQVIRGADIAAAFLWTDGFRGESQQVYEAMARSKQAEARQIAGKRLAEIELLKAGKGPKKPAEIIVESGG